MYRTPLISSGPQTSPLPCAWLPLRTSWPLNASAAGLPGVPGCSQCDWKCRSEVPSSLKNQMWVIGQSEEPDVSDVYFMVHWCPLKIILGGMMWNVSHDEPHVTRHFQRSNPWIRTFQSYGRSGAGTYSAAWRSELQDMETKVSGQGILCLTSKAYRSKVSGLRSMIWWNNMLITLYYISRLTDCKFKRPHVQSVCFNLQQNWVLPTLCIEQINGSSPASWRAKNGRMMWRLN